VTHLKRGNKPGERAPSSTTRAEVERMIAELKERTLQSPDKAAKILSNWIHGTRKPQKKNKTAA